jgi:hypothetical protein
MKIYLYVLKYTLAYYGFYFIFEVKVYEVITYCVFTLSIGMHNKTPQPDVGAVRIDTTNVEMSNVVAPLTSFC